MLTRKQLEDASKCVAMVPPLCEKYCSCFVNGKCIVKENIFQTALTLLDMLKKVEWSLYTRCPVCREKNMFGHSPDCSLGNLLREMRGK